MRKGFIEATEKVRRFYTSVGVEAADGGFKVTLDGRNVRSPGGKELVLPTRALADLVAREWAAQGETIELARMHATRLANTAVDSIPGAREDTAENIASYAGADLLCYFAEAPAGLVERQDERWSPWLTRAEQELGLVFARAEGILHRQQPPATLARVKLLALELDDFSLAGLAFGVALFGSAVLAFALQRGWLGGVQAYELSRLDEAWQEEKWGVDEEAAQRVERLRGEAQMLEAWFKALLARA